MTDDLVHVPVEPDPLAGVEKRWRIAQRVADTEFVPQAFRRRPEAVLAAIQFGAELGIGPMQSLQSIDVIQGKPTLSAEAMRARVFAAGHTITTEAYTDEECVLVGTRKDGTTDTVKFTMEDARRAGLAGKESWKKYPRSMLLARATSELCRMLFPDVLSAASYTVEELVDEDETIAEAVIVPNITPKQAAQDAEWAEAEAIEIAEQDQAERSEDLSGAVPGPETDPEQGLVAPASDPVPGPPSAELPITEIPTVSKMRVHDLHARVSALQARKVSVADARKAAGLALLKEGITVSEFREWEALVEGLEKDNP